MEIQLNKSKRQNTLLIRSRKGMHKNLLSLLRSYESMHQYIFLKRNKFKQQSNKPLCLKPRLFSHQISTHSNLRWTSSTLNLRWCKDILCNISKLDNTLQLWMAKWWINHLWEEYLCSIRLLPLMVSICILINRVLCRNKTSNNSINNSKGLNTLYNHKWLNPQWTTLMFRYLFSQAKAKV